MASQKKPTMPERRKLLVAGAGIAAVSLIPHVSAEVTSSQVNLSRQTSQRPTALGKRKLGKLEVSAVGLGVQNMSRKYDTSIPRRPEMLNVIHRAFDEGVTFFDSAEAYGPFEVEKILGEGVAPFRDKIVIATKFGWNIDQQTGKRLPGLNSRPEHIRQVVDNMLKRLRTDRIDLLYQHRVDPQIPIESEYSMLWRGPEKQVLPVCEELGIGFVPWSPLGVQFLTGWIDGNTRFAAGDIRAIETRFSPDNLPHNLQLVELLKTWAIRKNAAPGQIALAWLLARKPWIVPIPGTTNKDHMLQNTAATSVSLTSDEMTELTRSLDAITIQGQRLPDAVQVYSDVEAPLKS